MATSFVAEQAYYLHAPPTKVFRALTDPTVLVKWFLAEAVVSPRKGGEFVFDWVGGYHMKGRLLGYAKNRSVSFLWTDKLPSGKRVETEASFRLARKGRGTMLRLRHSGFTVPEHFAECSSRWAYYLTNLKSVLEHGTDLRSRLDW